jgi:ATP-dependent DNA helicase PIF1
MKIIQAQQDAIAAMKGGENVFIHAPAGTGKSWCIDHINEPETTVMSASTGIAAVNIKGITTHKAFGLPLGYPTDKDWTKLTPNVKEIFGLDSPVERVVIDEAGMLSVYQLDVIDLKLQKLRKNKKPFGGIQMVLSGDMGQLEPIINKDERQLLSRNYKSHFVFDANVFHHIRVKELTEVVRQSDAFQVGLLQNIRKGVDIAQTLDIIKSISQPYINCEDTLHLCAYNADADLINKYWYSKVKGREHTYWGNGNEKLYPVDKELKLKVGTRVIICANCPLGAYVNGDKGVIVDMDAGGVTVRKANGQDVYVTEFEWIEYGLSNEGGSLVRKAKSIYSQIPLRMGWAISIHKSQGQTLDGAAIHVGKGLFGAGQAYTGLSRIKDLRNLSFVNPMSAKDVIVNKRVMEWMNGGR